MSKVKRVIELGGLLEIDTEASIKHTINTYGLGCIDVKIISNKKEMRALATCLNVEQRDIELQGYASIDHMKIIKTQALELGLKSKNYKNSIPQPLNPVEFAKKLHDAHLADHPKFGEVMQNGGFMISTNPSKNVLIIQDEDNQSQQIKSKKKKVKQLRFEDDEEMKPKKKIPKEPKKEPKRSKEPKDKTKKSVAKPEKKIVKKK